MLLRQRCFRPQLLLILCIALLSSCGGDPSDPSPGDGDLSGAIRVAVSSAGTPPDGDGYTVRVDDGSPHATAGSGSIVIKDLDPGEHSVLLDGVAAHCTAAGENPRVVVVVDGDTTETAFDVTCAPTTGSITVSTATGGLSLDPDGYLVSVDGGTDQPVEANGTITLSNLTPGEHTVELSDVEPNCSVEAGANPQTTAVSIGQTAEIAFELNCESLGNRIAFDSNRDGNYEIYIMNADGSGVARLTTNSAADGSPAISPDGARIAFNSERDGNFEIYVMNADGSDQRRLTEAFGSDVSPVWSPDGKRLAFVSGRNGVSQMFIMNADGSNQVQRTTSVGDTRNPAWSPDGTMIAYEADVEDSEILVISADGRGSPVNLTQDPATDGLPSWSPDGTRLTFFSAREGPRGDSEIFIMNADGSDQTPLTDNDDFEFDSVWSPDGSRIVFSTDRDGDREIYVMNADGSGQTNLTRDDADDELPDWGR